jgi:hypothetical protein
MTNFSFIIVVILKRKMKFVFGFYAYIKINGEITFNELLTVRAHRMC